MSDFYALAFEKLAMVVGSLLTYFCFFNTYKIMIIIYSKLKRYQINYLLPKKTPKIVIFLVVVLKQFLNKFSFFCKIYLFKKNLSLIKTACLIDCNKFDDYIC